MTSWSSRASAGRVGVLVTAAVVFFGCSGHEPTQPTSVSQTVEPAGQVSPRGGIEAIFEDIAETNGSFAGFYYGSLSVLHLLTTDASRGDEIRNCLERPPSE